MENFSIMLIGGWELGNVNAKGEMETTPARLVLEGKLGPGRK